MLIIAVKNCTAKLVMAKVAPSMGVQEYTGEVVREEKDMAELLNRFFSLVFMREDSNNIPEPKEKVEKAGLSQVKITRAKVKSKIKKLRAGAAAGPDGIGPQLLKALVEQVAGPLAVICQQTGWKLM